MIKFSVRPTLLVLASLMLFACASEKLELEVKARMDGKPAAQAKITVDGEEQGVTDTNGTFSKILNKKPGAEVEVAVSKEMPGYRIKPWKTTFLVKLPKSGTVEKYSFDAELPASRYVMIIAMEKESPVPDAVVSYTSTRNCPKGELI
jgi:hypothetical protein